MQTAYDHAVEPKVQRPFVVAAGEVPRKIEIERRKRHFAAQNLEQLLAQAGLSVSQLLPCGPYKSASPSPFLALELFDDTEFDSRTPQDWIALGSLNGIHAGVPAKALLPDDESSLAWTDCLVMSFNASTSLFTATVSGSGAEHQLPRLLIMFKAEDPAVFTRRVDDACQRRLRVESELMYNLYIDCMPREEAVRPSDASFKHMAEFALGKGFAASPPFVDLAVRRLPLTRSQEYAARPQDPPGGGGL